MVESSDCEYVGRPNATEVPAPPEFNGGKCSAFIQSSKSVYAQYDSLLPELEGEEFDLTTASL